MIEQQTIGGRLATIIYLENDLTPAPTRNAPMAKVIFDDGEIMFLKAPRRVKDENPYHQPAGSPIGGQFAPAPGGLSPEAKAIAAQFEKDVVAAKLPPEKFPLSPLEHGEGLIKAAVALNHPETVAKELMTPEVKEALEKSYGSLPMAHSIFKTKQMQAEIEAMQQKAMATPPPPPAPKPEPPPEVKVPVPINLDPEVVNVGGDEWNQKTAIRLEQEYQDAKPKLEQVANDLVASGGEAEIGGDEDNEYYAPQTWDEMTGNDQEKTFEHWQNTTGDDFLESEKTSWYENEAASEAGYRIAGDFTDDPPQAQWAMDAIQELRNARSEEGREDYPYTNEQILEALNLEYDRDSDAGYGEVRDKNIDIGFDPEKLQEPSNAPPKEQLSFPEETGLNYPKDLSHHLTQEMRDEISDAVRDAFKDEAEKLKDKLEPPDYLGDNVSEFQEETWNGMSNKQKYEWATQHDIIEETEPSGSGGRVEYRIPEHWDPLQSDQVDQNYRQTQAMARGMSEARAADLILERKIDTPATISFRPAPERRESLVDAVRRMDSKLWDGWKGSSNNLEGKLLQLAAADELGSRPSMHRGFTGEGWTPDANAAEKARANIIRYADDYFKPIGGYEGVKAYLRAKWETTQYMLDKASVKTLQLYRGISLPGANESRAEEVPVPTQTLVPRRNYVKLPDLKWNRSGMQSTSLTHSVSDRWRTDQDGVLLRIRAPRTAAVSVPAYGINVHGEREVVVAGTALEWEAWRPGMSPRFEDLPFGKVRHAA